MRNTGHYQKEDGFSKETGKLWLTSRFVSVSPHNEGASYEPVGRVFESPRAHLIFQLLS
jgi:hypothetical protein